MRLEGTLIEGDPESGVRSLGLTTDETLVELVREHLIQRLDQPQNQREPSALQLVPRLGADGSPDRDSGT